ncbi:ABC-three component system middle component 4 [Paenibacillus polymyxa]|uniref:ABC-three component system middle component 4 n=1 Tax=Paenibacillus polymyxa TaxID=1406 RepID=UPI003B5C5CD6
MNIMQNNNLPVSLRLLFNNPFLEMMNVLFVINSFSKRSGLSIRYILFYYSLSISDSDPLIFEKKSDLNASLDNENIYFGIQSQIKEILLNLYSQRYITISNEKNDDFKCSLTAEGKEVLTQLESSYYKKLQERINTIKTQTKYSVEGEKIIMGVKK